MVMMSMEDYQSLEETASSAQGPTKTCAACWRLVVKSWRKVEARNANWLSEALFSAEKRHMGCTIYVILLMHKMTDKTRKKILKPLSTCW